MFLNARDNNNNNNKNLRYFPQNLKWKKFFEKTVAYYSNSTVFHLILSVYPLQDKTKKKKKREKNIYFSCTAGNPTACSVSGHSDNSTVLRNSYLVFLLYLFFIRLLYTKTQNRYFFFCLFFSLFFFSSWNYRSSIL